MPVDWKNACELEGGEFCKHRVGVMPVQPEHLEEAHVKRRQTFQKQHLLSSFSLLAKFLSGAKRRAACCCRRGERVYRGKKIITKEEKTVKSALTDRTDSASEPSVGAGDGSWGTEGG